MPKEFHEWVSNMANSIEDRSAVKQKEIINKNTPNPMQKRGLIADMLVGKVITEDDVSDWLSAFCVDLDARPFGYKTCCSATLSTIIGKKKSQEYYILEDIDVLSWFFTFRDSIRKGEFICKEGDL